MKSLINNFFRGLVLILPVTLTLYIIVAAVNWINSTLNRLIFEPFSISIPGLGIITVFVAITLLGFICGLAFTRPMVNFFERILLRTPLVKIIYTSIKELTEALFGENKKFKHPVLIDLNSSGTKKLGFITERDLSYLGLNDLVSVYCPHSYNFSGNLFLVPREQITELEIHSTEMMKYIVSAGITKIDRNRRGMVTPGNTGLSAGDSLHQ